MGCVGLAEGAPRRTNDELDESMSVFFSGVYLFFFLSLSNAWRQRRAQSDLRTCAQEASEIRNVTGFRSSDFSKKLFWILFYIRLEGKKLVKVADPSQRWQNGAATCRDRFSKIPHSCEKKTHLHQFRT